MNKRCAVHPVEAMNGLGVCTACVAAGVGAKADDGKAEWTYLLWDLADACEEVIAVLVFGTKKYARGNYAEVDDARRRYTEAAVRHLRKARRERNDDEPGGSGRNHYAAAACSCLFLCAMDLRGKLDSLAHEPPRDVPERRSDDSPMR